MWLKIALRNTFRNRRRTALNVVMIASGVVGIILFRGFTYRILYDLQDVTIRTDTGHLQVAMPVYWEKTARKAKQALLPDYQKLLTDIRALPHVRYASGRLSFYGLLSLGDDSTSAQGITLDPASEVGRNESIHLVAGHRLDPSQPHQILVGSGLAKRMRIHPGDTVTALGYTFDGMVNALDMEVAGIFLTDVSEIDDSTFIIPLSSAQTLLDTEKVQKIVVGLDDTALTDTMRGSLEQLITRDGSSAQVKTWLQLAAFYNKCASFFSTQNKIFQFIILALVLLGVLNTIGMSVFERAGEIGTVRALGETEGMVLFQFLIEGALLGLIGALAGVVCGTGLAHFISWLDIPLVIPGATQPVRVSITPFLWAYVEAIALAIGASVCAAVIPAFRASRMNITESLKRYV